MKDADKTHEELINPIYMREIQTEKQFVERCNCAAIEDLESDLRVFMDAEMYEECSIIRDILTKKRKKSCK